MASTEPQVPSFDRPMWPAFFALKRVRDRTDVIFHDETTTPVKQRHARLPLGLEWLSGIVRIPEPNSASKVRQ